MPVVIKQALVIAGLYLLYHLLRYIICILHEMGHAIATVVLTGEKATVYIGSHGDPRNCLNLRSKWFDIYLRYNPFRARGGVCRHQSSGIPWRREIVITLAGVLTTFSSGVAFCYTAHVLDCSYWVRITSVMFLGLALVDMGTNLYPRSRPVVLYGGSIAYHDGYKALWLLRNRDYSAEWNTASAHYSRKEYGDAARLFDELLHRGMRSRELYRNAIYSCDASNQLHKASEIMEVFRNEFELEAPDLSLSGMIHSKLERYEEGLADYREALLRNPTDTSALNNRGYTLNLLERYPEAIEDFDEAIRIEPDGAYAFNNRGLAKIKLGMTEEGLADIRHSLALEENNSYAYRNLGIYHFDRGEFSQALELFMKAHELDSSTHLIDQYIVLARQHIGNSKAA